MKRTILSVSLAALCLAAVSCAPSNLAKETQLAGKWETGKGASAESVSFTIVKGGKNRYVSYHRSRFFESGTWEIKDGKLDLTLNNGKKRSYSEFRLENNRLVLKEAGGMAESFDAAGGQIKEGPVEPEKPAQPEPSDFRISGLKELLLNLRSSTGIDFNEPRRSTFTWSISDGGDITVFGMETEAGIPVSGDFSELKARANDAARYFYSIGFDGDAANTTEITIGAKKGKLVAVVVLPWTDNRAPEGAFPLKVRCGYIR